MSRLCFSLLNDKDKSSLVTDLHLMIVEGWVNDRGAYKVTFLLNAVSRIQKAEHAT